VFGVIIHVVAGMKVYGLGIFGFFTVLSNIAVSVYYIVFFLVPKKVSLLLKGYILEPILLTGILNWFILVPISVKYTYTILPLLRRSNIFVHGIIPLLVLIDWFVFDHKRNYTRYEPIQWAIFPLIYNFLIYIKEYLGANGYPYPFYDPNMMHGWSNVIACLLMILFLYIAIGYGLVYTKKEVGPIERM